MFTIYSINKQLKNNVTIMKKVDNIQLRGSNVIVLVNIIIFLEIYQIMVE